MTKRVTGSRLGRAFSRAAVDLGLEFQSPYFLDHEGRRIEIPGLLRNFGNPKGTAIIAMDEEDSEEAAEAAQTAGFSWSELSSGYERYQKALFVDALSDWGWYGPPEKAPPWLKPRGG